MERVVILYEELPMISDVGVFVPVVPKGGVLIPLVGGRIKQTNQRMSIAREKGG
jgi:hypothetical protein